MLMSNCSKSCNFVAMLESKNGYFFTTFGLTG